MTTHDDYPENWNRDGDSGKRGRIDDFAQTDVVHVSTPYTTNANADDIIVRGMVLDENNHALEGATVTFWDQWRGKALYRTTTQQNGEWFLRVPSDQYYLAFLKDDLYDEVGYVMIVPQTDRVQEFPTVTLNFNPPEFRITPTEKYYIKCLRAFLRDNNPNAYELDEKRYLYNDDDLVVFTHMALNDVNSFPAKTNFQLHEIPPQWRTLVILGASVFALISRSILENQNQFDYSDSGLTLNIKRAENLKSSANDIFQKYVEARVIVKSHWKIAPHTLLRASIPFHVRSFSPRQWRLR